MSDTIPGMAPPMAPDPFDETERAKWPSVVGWLSIVFGSISLTCGGLGTVFTLFFMGAFMSMATQGSGGDPPPAMTFSPVAMGLMILGVLWQIPLIIAGITTLVRKKAGRPLHLMYAIGFAVTVIPSSLVTWQETQAYNNSPELAQWKAENSASPMAAGLGANQSPVWMIPGLALNLAWPTFCVIWFLPAGRSERALRRDEEDALV